MCKNAVFSMDVVGRECRCGNYGLSLLPSGQKNILQDIFSAAILWSDKESAIAMGCGLTIGELPARLSGDGRVWNERGEAGGGPLHPECPDEEWTLVAGCRRLLPGCALLIKLASGGMNLGDCGEASQLTLGQTW